MFQSFDLLDFDHVFSSYRDEVAHVNFAPDGSIYFGLKQYDLSSETSDFDINISKYTSAFEEEWSYLLASEGRYGDEISDLSDGLYVDDQGSIYVIGYTGGKFDFSEEIGVDDKNVFVLKLDSRGNRQFIEYFGREEDGIFQYPHMLSYRENINSITTAKDGSILIAGSTSETSFEGQLNPKWGNSKSIFIAKLSHDGNLIWSQLINGDSLSGQNSSDIAENVATDSKGGIIIAGTTNSAVFDGITNPSGNSESIFLTKLSKDGVVEWTQLVDSPVTDVFYDLAIDDNNDIYISGVKNIIGDENGRNSSFIAKYSSAGELQWDEYLINQSGGSRWSSRESMLTISNDGEIYVAAQFGANPCSPGNMPLIDQNYISYCSASMLQKWSLDGDKEWTQSLSHELADDGLHVEDIGLFENQIYFSGFASWVEEQLGNTTRYDSGIFVASINLEELEPGPVDVDADGFVDEITNYQMWTASGGVDLTNRRGTTYSDDTSRKWDAVKAVESVAGFSVLVEGHLSKDGKYKVISADEEGIIGRATRWLNGSQMLDSGYEEVFAMDFNGNGVIDLV